MKKLNLLAIALIACPSVAQTFVTLKPATTAGAWRGGLGAGPGELLMGLHKSHWRGLGDDGSACAVDGFRITIQDSDLSTQDPFFMTIRNGTDGAGPTTGTAGLVARYGAITLPQRTGGGAFLLTINIASPATIPCEEHVAIGVELNAATSATDALSLWVSEPSAAAQHANAEDMFWQIVGAAPTATHPAGKRSFAIEARFDKPTLQMSNDGLRTIGGMFPLVGGTYAGNVSGAEVGGSSLLFIGVDDSVPGFPLAPGTARLYLGATNINLLTTATVDANGDALHTLGTVPSLSVVAKLYFQAAVLGANQNLTNMQATTFDN